VRRKKSFKHFGSKMRQSCLELNYTCFRLFCEQPFLSSHYVICQCNVADPDLGSDAFCTRDPGSGMETSGSGNLESAIRLQIQIIYFLHFHTIQIIKATIISRAHCIIHKFYKHTPFSLLLFLERCLLQTVVNTAMEVP
jgi:hypothetical protein